MRFRVWHDATRSERKPTWEAPTVGRSVGREEEHKETLLRSTSAENPPCSVRTAPRGGIPAGCQGGIRGEFACVKWHQHGRGRKVDGRTRTSISTFGFLSARFSTFLS